MSDRRLLVGAEGTHQGELRPADWVALGTVALTWGASFLFIAIGLDAFHPAAARSTRPPREVASS